MDACECELWYFVSSVNANELTGSIEMGVHNESEFIPLVPSAIKHNHQKIVGLCFMISFDDMQSEVLSARARAQDIPFDSVSMIPMCRSSLSVSLNSGVV